MSVGSEREIGLLAKGGAALSFCRPGELILKVCCLSHLPF